MAATKKSTRKRAAAKRAKAPAARPPAEPADPTAPKMTEEQRAFAVRCIACFDTPSTVVDKLKDEYGVEITRQSVEYYDPRKNPSLSTKWRSMHDAARETFLKETQREPAAERAYRVRQLADMAAQARRRGNFKLASELLRQIAEEMGGKYTNKLELASDLDAIAKVLGMDRAMLAAALEGSAT